jgi:hypothetical protein
LRSPCLQSTAGVADESEQVATHCSYRRDSRGIRRYWGECNEAFLNLPLHQHYMVVRIRVMDA